MKLLNFVFLMVLIGGCLCAMADSQKLDVYYIDKEPYYYKDRDKVSGFLFKKAEKYFEQLNGVAVSYSEMPPKRILFDLEELEGNFCSIGWFKNKERALKYWYSPILYRDRSMVLIIEKKYQKDLSMHGRFYDFIKNTPLKIDVVNGYSYGELIDEVIAKFPSSFNKESSDNNKLIRLLKNERTNGILMMEEEFEHFSQKETILLDKYTIKTFSDFPKGNERYIICSKKTSPKILTDLKKIMSIND